MQPIVAGVVMAAGLGGTGPGVQLRDAVGAVLIIAGAIFAVAKSTLDRGLYVPSMDEDDEERSDGGNHDTVAAGANVAGGLAGAAAVGQPIVVINNSATSSSSNSSKSDYSYDGVGGRVGGGGTVIVKRGADGELRTLSSTGTIRLRKPASGKPPPPPRPDRRVILLTVCWALFCSLASLAGGGLIVWSVIYLYWRFLC